MSLTENASETWIGLSSNKTPVSFEWSNGSSVTFTNWHTLEPQIFPNRSQLCVSAEKSVSLFVCSMLPLLDLYGGPPAESGLWQRPRTAQYLLLLELPCWPGTMYPQGKQGDDSCHDGSEETGDMMVGAATSDGIAREGTLKT